MRTLLFTEINVITLRKSLYTKYLLCWLTLVFCIHFQIFLLTLVLQEPFLIKKNCVCVFLTL